MGVVEEKLAKLEKVKQDIVNNLVCPLKDEATNIVFGKGNPDADILFIGEAPGKEEDLQGLPFVGKAGKNLDEQLKKIDLSLDECYIANILKYRPPKNRDPTKEEMLDHTPYLIKQIEIINPKIIITLGNFSTKFILNGFKVAKMNKIDGVSKLHGQIIPIDIDNQKFNVFPMLHPAAIIYRRAWKEDFENDFLKLRNFL